MPKLSDTMSEGVVVKWHKKVGDSVAAGELLAEIETDKATMEFESCHSGVLSHILVEAGNASPVGVAICILEGSLRTNQKGSVPNSEELVAIEMPKLSDNMPERVVMTWHVSFAESVVQGQRIAEFKYDGDVFTITSPCDGVFFTAPGADALSKSWPVDLSLGFIDTSKADTMTDDEFNDYGNKLENFWGKFKASVFEVASLTLGVLFFFTMQPSYDTYPEQLYRWLEPFNVVSGLVISALIVRSFHPAILRGTQASGLPFNWELVVWLLFAVPGVYFLTGPLMELVMALILMFSDAFMGTNFEYAAPWMLTVDDWMHSWRTFLGKH